MADNRTITVHREKIGEPGEFGQPMIHFEIYHTKGYGLSGSCYVLNGRVQKEKDILDDNGALIGTSNAYLLHGGIRHSVKVEDTKRFSRKRLQTLAAQVQEDTTLAALIDSFKEEFARRLETGERY